MANAKATRTGTAPRIYIGFSSDGAEIIATYTSRREVDEFRQPDEIVTGPWMRVPRKSKPSKCAKSAADRGSKSKK